MSAGAAADAAGRTASAQVGSSTGPADADDTETRPIDTNPGRPTDAPNTRRSGSDADATETLPFDELVGFTSASSAGTDSGADEGHEARASDSQPNGLAGAPAAGAHDPQSRRFRDMTRPRLRLWRDPHGNSLAVLGGARSDAVQDAPGDRQIYTAMAFVLMFTATVAALSIAFALGMVFHADWYWFIPLGLFWGAGIFAIDRALTIQLGKTKGALRTIIAVVPRLALAGILGAVISTPVTLQIFGPEISAEILTMEAEARTAFEQQLATDPVIATEDGLRETVASSQATIDQSGIDPLDDPTYAAAKAAEDAALADFNAKTEAWVAESNGTGGTGVVGTGPVTDIAKAAADAAGVTYDNAKAAADAALAAAQSSLGDQLVDQKAAAETALAKAQTALDAVEARKSELQAQNDAAVASSDGISNRLTALDRLSHSSPSAGTAHVMVFLLFFAIELLPVIIKLLRNLGKEESVHDIRAREHDETKMELARQHQGIARDEAKLDREIALGSLMTKRALAAHAEELALESGRRSNIELDKRARRRADRTLAEYDEDERILGR